MSIATTPDEVTLDHVPELRSSILFVDVADEAVLYDDETGVLHQLDPIGALVCRLFDGTASIRQTVDDLAEVFDAPRDAIEADVLALTRDLGARGALKGIEATIDLTPDKVEPDDC